MFLSFFNLKEDTIRPVYLDLNILSSELPIREIQDPLCHFLHMTAIHYQLNGDVQPAVQYSCSTNSNTEGSKSMTSPAECYPVNMKCTNLLRRWKVSGGD